VRRVVGIGPTQWRSVVIAAALAAFMVGAGIGEGAPGAAPVGRLAWSGSSGIVVSVLDGTRRWSPGEGSPRGWSPDGTRLLFEKKTPDGFGLYVLDVTTRSSRLLFDATGAGIDKALWSGDGSRVLFEVAAAVCTDDSDGNTSLFVVGADGTGLRKLGIALQGYLVAWSPNGNSALALQASRDCYAYTPPYPGSAPDPGALLSLPVDGGRQIVLARNVVRVGRPALEDAAWSPDGQRVGFTRCHGLPGGDVECSVWVARADGTRPRLLVPERDPGPIDSSLVWTRNGAEILYARGSHRARWQKAQGLGVVNSSNGRRRSIPTLAWPRGLTPSMEGNEVALIAGSEAKPSLVVVDLRTRRQWRHHLSPTWGSWLAVWLR
jgi:hypothetical protein